MQDATLVAYGACCQLLLKIVPVSSEATGGGGGGSAAAAAAGHRLTSENVSKLVFLHPQLPVRCINAQFRGPSTAFASGVQVHVVFSSEADRDQRLSVLRSFFPRSEASVCSVSHGVSSLDSMLFHYLQTTTKSRKHNHSDPSSSSSLASTLVATLPSSSSDDTSNPIWEEFNPEWANDLGETIWMADVTVQMNKYTKQYEQISQVAVAKS